MYPTAQLARVLEGDENIIRPIWEALNQITPSELISEGRVYGGGLHKLEPRELGNVDATFIAKFLPELIIYTKTHQLGLFRSDAPDR